jgi:hypothetical protein
MRTGTTNTLILRMYKPDPYLNGTAIDEIEPPVLYVGNTLENGARCVPDCFCVHVHVCLLFVWLATTFDIL